MYKISSDKKLAISYLTRCESFCASHRLHNSLLDDATNAQLFGKCNNLNGHGHNYKLEVTVKGIVNAITGMVIDIAQLKRIIDDTVMKQLDHKNIDLDVDYFLQNNIVSTAENIAVFIWKLIEDQLPVDIRLHCIKLYETDKNIVEFRGEFSQ